MKFKINKNKVFDYRNFLRRAGYALILDRRRGVESFVLRLGDGYYPRLHLYIDEVGDDLIFSLHLDQKKASYQGFHMHNAEYDDKIVVDEINKLKNLLGFSEFDNLDNFKNKVNNNVKKEENPVNFKINNNEEVELLDQIDSGKLDDDLARMIKIKKKKKFLFF